MEDLPSSVLLSILNLLPDSNSLAQLRLTSKTLLSLSYQTQSIHLHCSHARFLQSRRAQAQAHHLIPPFKALILNNISLLSNSIRSLSIGIDNPFIREEEDDDVDDEDDLHFTSVDFLKQWVPVVGGRLRSLEISDYWVQSCWRNSHALALLSHYCCGTLQDLVVRNAWLSVEGLKPMPKLTTLTLEFIRLDDEDLHKLNECFPSLEVLNLIGVGGFKDPKVNLSRLRVCHWTVSNFPRALSIHAPKLIELKLECVEPDTLVLETPLLSNLDFKVKKPGRIINSGGLLTLTSVILESLYLSSLIQVFLCNKTVKKLELKSPLHNESDQLLKTITIMDLVRTFPGLEDLKLSSGAWTQLEKSFGHESIGITCDWRNFKKLTVHLTPSEFDITFLSFLLNLCTGFCKVALLVPANTSTSTRKHITSLCTSNFPKVMWKWGVWNKSVEDEFFEW